MWRLDCQQPARCSCRAINRTIGDTDMATRARDPVLPAAVLAAINDPAGIDVR